MVSVPAASVQSHIADLVSRIEERDGMIRAFCDTRLSEAVNDARDADAVSQSRRRPLHGLGVAIKEIFDVRGMRCAWGSPMHAGRTPDNDSAIVAKVKAAGAIVLGTVASTEYAMAREAPTTNPHDPTRTPGASSSGSAAAVAAGMADVALGSQTIGSGIRPAAYCGVIGFKPTHGWTSLAGAMPLSETLDHAVIFGSNSEVVKRAFDALSDTPARTSERARSLRIGLVAPWFEDDVDQRVWNCIDQLAQAVAPGDCVRLTVPPDVAAREEQCLGTILAADMWRHHADDYARASSLMSDMLKAWLERGRQVTLDAYRTAHRTRTELQERFWHEMVDVDVLVTVSTTGLAPLRSEGTGSRAPQRLWTLLGCPAMSVPIGTIDGLPIGAQLIARPGCDSRLLEFIDEVAL